MFSRLVRQSGLYALSNLALKLSGLILVPIYLNVLTEDSFGHFALLDATAKVAILVAGLGLSTGLLRFMTNPAYEEAHDALPFTALVAAGTAALAAFLLFWAAAPALARGLVDDPGQAVLVRLMAAYAAFKVVEAVPLMLMRTRERVGLYVLANGLEMLLLIAGVLLLVLRMDRGLRGVMEAFALSGGVGTLVLVAGMLARVPLRFRGALLGPLVRFGAPLVLAGLAGLFMNIGDRYLLKAMEDAATVGIYDWAARLGGALNMLFVNSFQLAFGVLGLKALGDAREGAQVYRRAFRHFVIWTGWCVLGLSLLTYDFTRLVADKPAYLAAEVLVLPIALGFMAYGIYYIMMNVLFVGGRTGAIAGMVFGAAVLNAGLNVVLIPPLGAFGSALATLAAYTLLMALAARAARRHVDVDYAWGKLALVVALVVGLFFLGLPARDWATAPRLLLRGSLIVLYLPLLIVTGLYTPDELRRARALVAERLRAWRARSVAGDGAGGATGEEAGGEQGGGPGGRTGRG